MQTPRPPLKVCVCVRERAAAQHPIMCACLPACLPFPSADASIPFRVHIYIQMADSAGPDQGISLSRADSTLMLCRRLNREREANAFFTADDEKQKRIFI
jgi:hypothetical protein